MAKGKKKVVKKESANLPSEGLGDSIEKITKATGIKKVVEAVSKATGLDCGCDKRKEKLNTLFHFPVKCLEEDEYAYLKDFFVNGNDQCTHKQWIQLSTIATRVFNKRIGTSMGCKGCIIEVVGRLRKVYDTYEEKNNK